MRHSAASDDGMQDKSYIPRITLAFRDKVDDASTFQQVSVFVPMEVAQV
jgi:hypothetical protein